LEILTYRSIPLDEFNRAEKLLSMAFLYLFPKGKADFYTPRLRIVTFKEYINHTLRWHNGRFIRHPTFTYVVYNQLQRQQIRAKSSFFVKKTSNDPDAT